MTKWKTALFSDEPKFNFKGSDGFRSVRTPKRERLNTRFPKGTVKHGGGYIIVWNDFPVKELVKFTKLML